MFRGHKSGNRTLSQDGLTGSAWGDWANYTASPLRAFENELGVQALRFDACFEEIHKGTGENRHLEKGGQSSTTSDFF